MVVDLFLVYQFIRRLATPFNKWKAYEAGVIDANGKILVKKKDRDSKQKKAWGIFDRMIANLKKLLAKVPGGSSKFASYAAALFLIKEYKAFTDESLLNEDLTDEQLEESLLLFNDRYVNYINESMNVKALNEKAETFLAMVEDKGPCWSTHKQVGMKKKGNRIVPNCVPKEAFGRARLRQNLAKQGMDVDKVHSDNVKDADAAKKRAKAASKDLASFRKKNGINTAPVANEEPANNAGSGNIAGMDAGHMSKAGQKKWTKSNKSDKKKNLRDIMGVPTK